MKKQALEGCRPRKSRSTTDSKHDEPVAENCARRHSFLDGMSPMEYERGFTQTVAQAA